MEQKVKVKLLRKSAKMFSYQTEGASGLDLTANFAELGKVVDSDKEDCKSGNSIILSPGRWVLIPTGISLSIPSGYEAQVRSRSGLALKQGLSVLNSPGTIDSDYRGEIGVILFNNSKETREIKEGDRIAQLVFAKVELPLFHLETEQLDQTDRGEGGFGSTGNQ